MISVDSIYNRVNLDLSRKDKTGYTSNAEFNRDIAQAQVVLMNFYHRRYQAEKHFSEAVVPFKVPVDLTVSGGRATLPDNFRHMISVHATIVDSSCEDQPKSRVVPLEPIKDGANGILSGGIYSPDLDLGIAWYERFNSYLTIHPSELKKVTLTYLRDPAAATRAVDIDTVNDLETYNAANTVDLEWPDQEYSNFVSLLMFFKGVSLKENILIQFAQAAAVASQSVS